MQKLQTVLYGTKSSFVKATIYTRDLEIFKSLGFVESDNLLPENIENKSATEDIKSFVKSKMGGSK